MSTIYLFGGSSELGNSSANQIMSDQSARYSKFVKILRAESFTGSQDELIWDPTSAKKVETFLKTLSFSKGDLAIIATGTITLADTETSFIELDHQLIEQLIWINLTLPLIVVSKVASDLRKLGGGEIIVFTSAAAFPPQPSNLIYSHSKATLDALICQLRKPLSGVKVRTMIVRSAFSATPLNEGRQATPLAITPYELGVSVSKGHRKSKYIIWVPRSFALISFFLMFVPGLNEVANFIVKKSKSKQELSS